MLKSNKEQLMRKRHFSNTWSNKMKISSKFKSEDQKFRLNYSTNNQALRSSVFFIS